MVDLAPYKSTLQAEINKRLAACDNPRQAFLDELTSHGIKHRDVLAIDNLTRVDGALDKPGKASAWYVYHEIDAGDHTIGIASFGDWKLGFEQSWSSQSISTLTAAQRFSYNETREKMALKAKHEKLNRQAEAAEKAVSILKDVIDTPFSHAYLERKGVSWVNGLFLGRNNSLIVPVFDGDNITSLQFIQPDGEKRFLTGGKIQGCCFTIAGNDGLVIVCEGLATGLSLHEAFGATVVVAFNANNIYEVTSHIVNKYSQSKIVVAGDNDSETAGNPGKTKAEQAASALSIDSIIPECHGDFNDLHQVKGIDVVRGYIAVKMNSEKEGAAANNKATGKRKKVESFFMPQPVGVLKDLHSYYMATSGNRQEGFAMQTALALCSVIIGRSYRSNFNNYASLFFLNVARSGTGKEHTKTVVERILQKADMGYLINGDGYTSAGAVFSSLLHAPKHITIIDEFGRYLESSTSAHKGTSHQREANTKLMESIGRSHSTLRPPSYSTMTLKKEDADKLRNRVVHNPAITLVGMSTPQTLYETIGMGAIKDGFINRFLISISNAKREVRIHRPDVPVPQRILEWIHAVTIRAGHEHSATESIDSIELVFSDPAYALQVEFQQFCIDQADILESFGMAELPMRTNEMAMRIALIASLAENASAETIELAHMQFGVDYMKFLLLSTIKELKMCVSGSDYEAHKKEILQAIRERENGVSWSVMQRYAPFSKHKARDLRDILKALVDAGLVEEIIGGGPGGKGIKWEAVNTD